MTREQIIDQIKSRKREFRVWDDETQTMYDGDFIEEHGEMFETRMSYGKPLVAVEDPDWRELIIMDFAGQPDVNGKKIFDGDILFCDKQYWVVYFGQRDKTLINVFGWYAASISNGEICPLTMQLYSSIVGNIFENPELLEVA